MIEKISQKNSRNETKILIRSSSYYGIMDSIKNSNKRFREIYHPRYINNIYFDSYNFQSYHQNLNGDLNKRKVRIRWYGDLGGKIHPTLEYKVKKNLNCYKQKYKINPFSIDKRSFKKNIHQSIKHSKIPQTVKSDLKSLCPMFINRYNRQYFLSKDGSIRLTIDRFLKYYRLVNLRFPMGVNFIVVELKYNSHNASDVSLIVDDFGSRWSTFSKFFLGTDIIYS